MGYMQWYEEFAAKHRAIVERLKDKSREEILAYFDYENMRVKHPDFCPLYAQGVKCHEMEGLNCYFCGCPAFRFCDTGLDKIGGKTRYSLCAVASRWSTAVESATAIHQDCSHCPLPHRVGFIRRHFDRDWKRTMAEVPACKR